MKPDSIIKHNSTVLEKRFASIDSFTQLVGSLPEFTEVLEMLIPDALDILDENYSQNLFSAIKNVLSSLIERKVEDEYWTNLNPVATRIVRHALNKHFTQKINLVVEALEEYLDPLNETSKLTAKEMLSRFTIKSTLGLLTSYKKYYELLTISSTQKPILFTDILETFSYVTLPTINYYGPNALHLSPEVYLVLRTCLLNAIQSTQDDVTVTAGSFEGNFNIRVSNLAAGKNAAQMENIIAEVKSGSNDFDTNNINGGLRMAYELTMSDPKSNFTLQFSSRQLDPKNELAAVSISISIAAENF